MINSFKTNTRGNFNFERFFELSADLFCIAGYDGYFKRINAAVSKTLGYTNDELFSNPINAFVHPDDQIITERRRDNIRHSVPLLNFENRYITKTGEVVWLAWTSMPVDEEQLVFAIAKNITDKKRQEAERNGLIAHLTQINDDLKQLTYTTSHDLRSPVSNLLSVFNFIDVSKIQDPETAELIGMLRSASESLKETLNNYVDILSQKDSLNVHREDINVIDTLNTVLHSVSSLIHDSGVTINHNFPGDCTINFNKSYLESVFLNLITNSIKYARPEIAPVINISFRAHKDLKQILFADNGLGFDMNSVKDKIFGFQQTFHHHHDSKGIGLYLVYNHITSLGGQITIDSKPNEGATFIISFKD